MHLCVCLRETRGWACRAGRRNEWGAEGTERELRLWEQDDPCDSAGPSLCFPHSLTWPELYPHHHIHKDHCLRTSLLLMIYAPVNKGTMFAYAAAGRTWYPPWRLLKLIGQPLLLSPIRSQRDPQPSQIDEDTSILFRSSTLGGQKIAFHQTWMLVLLHCSIDALYRLYCIWDTVGMIK